MHIASEARVAFERCVCLDAYALSLMNISEKVCCVNARGNFALRLLRKMPEEAAFAHLRDYACTIGKGFWGQDHVTNYFVDLLASRGDPNHTL